MLWVKALHIIAVIAWFAGLFYLPRLFVYHADAPKGSQLSETLKIMERRLYNVIMQPAMGAVWITGPLLAYLMGAFAEPWLHAKLVLVVILSGFQGALGSWVRAFAEDRNTRPAKFYRIVNELPTLLLVGIVLLVVLKPF